MKLSIGIVGLPNVGKSTLFNALTKKSVPAENYPFCTIDPSVGIVAVPDERLDTLTKLSKSAKTLPAAIEFVDIAGLVAGAAEGAGLGNKFLSHIRDVDAIFEMVRIFPLKGGVGDITHVYGDINPIRDIEVINLELVLSDMQTVSKRIANIGKEVRKNDKQAIFENEVLQKLEKHLEAGKLALSLGLNTEEEFIVKSLHLLTMKPILYGFNKKSGEKNFDELEPAKFKELIKYVEDLGSRYVVVDAKIEDELKDFEGEERKEMFKVVVGEDLSVEALAKADGVNSLIKEGYKLLGLITYFTTGEDETRGWTIKKDSTAPVAGMAIHTDFKDKFIRAEVIAYSDLVASGSYAEARIKGLVRTEGKEYIVKDGDVIEFKI